MFAKVFVVCVLAFAVNALENVDIPNTFDPTMKYGLFKPFYKGVIEKELLDKDFMTREMMDMPYNRQFWWKKPMPLLMDRRNLPFIPTTTDDMLMMTPYDIKMRYMMERDPLFINDLYRRDLPYTTTTIGGGGMMMTPYDIKMRYINDPVDSLFTGYDLMKMKKERMMMMPYYQMMMQNYMMY